MKINQKFAKRAVVVASMTAGVIGMSSMFNEVQASHSHKYYNYFWQTCNSWGSGSSCIL